MKTQPRNGSSLFQDDGMWRRWMVSGLKWGLERFLLVAIKAAIGSRASGGIFRDRSARSLPC